MAMLRVDNGRWRGQCTAVYAGDLQNGAVGYAKFKDGRRFLVLKAFNGLVNLEDPSKTWSDVDHTEIVWTPVKKAVLLVEGP